MINFLKHIKETNPEIRNKLIKLANDVDMEVEGDFELNEDYISSFPVQILPAHLIIDYIEDIPSAAPGRPPVFFKLGYIRDLSKSISSKFRGGRGSEGNSIVRVLKCIEYSKLYTGVPWRDTNATKEADKILGTERHTGDKTGFSFRSNDNREAISNKIGYYGERNEPVLRVYIADDCKQRVKYFISIDDGDYVECRVEDLQPYCTPSQYVALTNKKQAVAGYDADNNAVYDKPVNNLYLKNIYMIDDLGESVF